jgi:hypothetical protein
LIIPLHQPLCGSLSKAPSRKQRPRREKKGLHGSLNLTGHIQKYETQQELDYLFVKVLYLLPELCEQKARGTGHL